MNILWGKRLQHGRQQWNFDGHKTLRIAFYNGPAHMWENVLTLNSPVYGWILADMKGEIEDYKREIVFPKGYIPLTWP